MIVVLFRNVMKLALDQPHMNSVHELTVSQVRFVLRVTYVFVV